jgi:hypothetical protein
VQTTELAIAIALRQFAVGRFSWIGCVLSAPAFLVSLSALSVAIQDRFIALDTKAAVEIITAMWLALVGGLVVVLKGIDNPWEDRKFASDFAVDDQLYGSDFRFEFQLSRLH